MSSEPSSQSHAHSASSGGDSKGEDVMDIINQFVESEKEAAGGGENKQQKEKGQKEPLRRGDGTVLEDSDKPRNPKKRMMDVKDEL